MRKENLLDDKYMSEWTDKIVEAVQTGNPKDLYESLGQYIPFKVKKHPKGNAYEATFDVEKDGETIRSYRVTIGKDHQVATSTDFGKVKMHVQTIIFSEAQAGVGVANLEGGTGLYVLNTVARIVLEYARTAHPKGFDFTAAETHNNDGGTTSSRRKAYRALAMMLGKDAGFVNLTKQKAMETGHFYIMEHNLFEKWQDAMNQSGLS